MNLLFRFAVLPVGCAALFQFDDVKPEFGLDDVADLSGLERVSRVLKLFDHLPAPEPSEVATLVFAARIGRELLGERTEILARTRTFEDIFGLSSCLARIEFGMRGDVGINLLIGGLDLRRILSLNTC